VLNRIGKRIKSLIAKIIKRVKSLIARNSTWVQRDKPFRLFVLFLIVMIVLLTTSITVGVIADYWTTLQGTTVLILLGTLIFNIFQVRELQKQRQDSQRPLITPIDRGNIIWPFSRGRKEEITSLCIRNVGAGSASNITLRVERRESDAPVIKLDNSAMSVSPLGVGDKAFVYQTKGDPAVSVNRDEWLVISYYDVFGNPFQTECQWNGWTWHNFKSERVN